MITDKAFKTIKKLIIKTSQIGIKQVDYELTPHSRFFKKNYVNAFRFKAWTHEPSVYISNEYIKLLADNLKLELTDFGIQGPITDPVTGETDSTKIYLFFTENSINKLFGEKNATGKRADKRPSL